MKFRGFYFVILFVIVFKSNAQTVVKQFYLSDPSMSLDCIDPIATLDNTTSQSQSLGFQPLSIGENYTGFAGITASSIFTLPSVSVSSGPNRMMLVGVSTKDGKVISISYGGIPLTLVGFIDGTNGGSNSAEIYVYRLINPPVGTANVVVTLDADYKKGIVVGATNFYGVNQTTPLGTFISASFTNTSTNFDLDVPSSIGDIVYDISNIRNASQTSSQTVLHNINTGSEVNGGASYKTGLTSSSLMRWTKVSTCQEVGRGGVSIKPATITSVTFTQQPQLCNALIIKSGQPITISNYVLVENGVMPLNPSITAQLKYGATNIITLSNPSYNNTTKLLTWTGSLASDIVIPAGQAISLTVTTAITDVVFKIEYDSHTKPSKIELPVSSFININSYAVYDAPYPGGNIITSAYQGSQVYLRAVVSNSVDVSDITSLNINIPAPGTNVSATQVATSGCTKTFEYTWDTSTFNGNYSIPSTAKSGFENTISSTAPLSFTVQVNPIITQTYTSSSTFTVPCGIIQITVEAWGGGGAGGSRANGDGSGGGGGGGAYARKVVTVIPGNTYAVNVGVGAKKTATTFTPASDSWFGSTSTLLAKCGQTMPDWDGGASLLGGNGGSATTSIGDVKYSGGNGAATVWKSYGGGGGSSATSSSNGTNASSSTSTPSSIGATGPVGAGNGGNGATTGGNGFPGTFPGGGGGGALKNNGTHSDYLGGNGGDGLVKIIYDNSTIIPTTIDFAGLNNDYLDYGNKHGQSALASFSIEAWVLQNTGTTGTRTIISKGDAKSGSLRGFQLFLNNGVPNFTWYNNSGATLMNIASPFALIQGKWHHVAVTYNGTTAKLYVDGIDMVPAGVNFSSIATGNEPFIIGAFYDSSTPTIPKNNFNGNIDEVKIWNTALTVQQIREMMNQEIEVSGTFVRGKIIPLDISGNLLWSNLKGYYPFNDSSANDKSGNSNNGSIINMCSVQQQTAPLPYTTLNSATNDWDDGGTWAYGSSFWQIPNAIGIDGLTKIDWNIVQLNHNINISRNVTLNGLNVNTASTLKANNDVKIEISKYLKLNGKIDLVGKSQLIQPLGSLLDLTSSGFLERDQLGQASKFNYNYWSSPVSNINNTTINHGFNVAGVMKDGTNPDSIQNINWTSGVNGSPTYPITLSSYWIFKFQNLSSNYANWSSVGQNGTLLAGQGYTLKGSGAVSANQNYTFVGKPNNGTITSTVLPLNLNLCGNPYPSAIDANAFISANSSAINGTLYFWEHYNTNSSHSTIQYQGGYATRTLVGGTPPISPTLISGLGSSSKIPGRFIPVGQGFFVVGSLTGGTITFDNSQRIFIKEDNVNSNSMFRVNNSSIVQSGGSYDNSEDNFTEEQFKKLRLGLNSSNNYHKQILIGFMNQYATSDYDNGYDGINIETPSNDLYFINGNNKLNIQGEGYFNVNNIFPMGVKTEQNGIVKFVIDGKENFNDNQDIFIYDNVTGTYNNINNNDFEINLPAGLYENRFSLRFANQSSLNVNQSNLNQGITIDFYREEKIININNFRQDVAIKVVEVYNLLGQNIASFKIDNQNASNIQLPFSPKNTGIYIIKASTEKGEISKKIISE